MNKIILIGATALALTACDLSAAKNEHSAKAADPHAGHTMPAAPNVSAEAAQSPSTAEFQAVNDKMHRDMAITFTGNPDKDFLAGMIPHHQGAIDMAQVVLKHGKDPKVRQLAQDIITAQKKEIADMQQWLKDME